MACFLQFIRENQRVHDKGHGVGHNETPGRYCTPLLHDHDALGIDLRRHVKTTIQKFTKGLGRWNLENHGPRKKRHKRPYTIEMLVDMFELDWKGWCEGDELLEMEVKAAMQVAIGVGFRKSDFLKNVEEFNFHVHLTKRCQIFRRLLESCWSNDGKYSKIATGGRLGTIDDGKLETGPAPGEIE